MHYRSGVDFSKKNMEQAAQGLERYNHFIEQLLQIAENGNDKIGTKNENNKTTNNKQNKEVEVLIKNSRLEFEKAMDDDFNAPLAWAAISEFVREMNKLIAEGNISMKDAQKCLQFMREIDSVFCAFTFEREKQTIDADVEKLIEERNKARKEKNWKRSDEIRDKLLKMGITLDDTPKGTVWHKAK
jgi:cysteinyl-tRNA synthetase